MSGGDSSNLPGRPFGGMDSSTLERCRTDLLARAVAVLRDGWSAFRDVWSTGEVLGVALTVSDLNEIARQGETENSALSRWACDLWGLSVGAIEESENCPRTRKFFESLAAVLRDDGCRAPVISEADVDDYARTVYEANRESGY